MKIEKRIKLIMFRKLLLIRKFEERVKVLYDEGVVIGAIHLYIGQEAVAVGVCQSLRKDDYVYSSHRGHGHAIAKTEEINGFMAELMGRETGVSKGHGGSMHLFLPEKGLMGGNGIVGGGIPLALGGAFTADYKGTDQVSVTFFSDGAANQGNFSEAINLAALWKLPVLFVCENNHYAATTPVEQSTAVIDIAGRAESYGVPAEKVNGNNVLEVYGAAEAAVKKIRAGEGPFLLECETYRIEPHCGIIPDERPEGEREEWCENDPLVSCARQLRDEGIPSDELKKMEEDVESLVDQAEEFGRGGPWPDPQDALHRSCFI